MNKMVFYEGDSFEELKECLKSYVKQEQIADLLDLLGEEKVLASDSETFSYGSNEPELRGYGKLIPHTHYFLNVKESTIVLAAAILSSQYMGTKVDMVMTLIALKNKLTELSEENGEICIVIEGLRRKEGFTESIFKENKGECINNYLQCQYNGNGICRLTTANIQEILDQLNNRNVCIKKDGCYKICF